MENTSIKTTRLEIRFSLKSIYFSVKTNMIFQGYRFERAFK
uniref:Uncharacterized protein n=1 Tax=Anguilla anguilla TaxID=7936 RepID=A0A0E9TQ69_ANGAN